MNLVSILLLSFIFIYIICSFAIVKYKKIEYTLTKYLKV